MRLKSKNKDYVRFAHKLFRQERFFDMCNIIWCYGEFDFFYDYCQHLKYKFKSDWMRDYYYYGVVNIYFDKHYNPNLLNPIQGEPRKDSWLDFYLGKDLKSIKELVNNLEY